MRWWDELSSSEPTLGNFPNAKKEEEARVFFGATVINVTIEDINILAQLLDQDPTLKSMLRNGLARL